MNNLSKLILLCITLYCGSCFAEEPKMSEEQAQKTWDEYHARIKNRRLAEVKIINEQMKSAGITSDTDLVLDFNFFTPKQSGAEGIKEQLSENYEMTIKQGGEYWHIDGTTKPYSITLSPEQHIGWVGLSSCTMLLYLMVAYSVFGLSQIQKQIKHGLMKKLKLSSTNPALNHSLESTRKTRVSIWR
jgi:hypothetical protein